MRRNLSELRAAACPRCGAGPGEKCILAGTRVVWVHPERDPRPLGMTFNVENARPRADFNTYIDGTPPAGLHPPGYRFSRCPCDGCVSAWRERQHHGSREAGR